MANKILPLFPPHEQYCEPYFGGGSLFFSKEPCAHETINDADEGVTTFFRILRDRGEEFIARASLTEYGEGLYRECLLSWADESDELLKAWKWWVVATQSFGGSFGASHGHSRNSSCRQMPAPVSAMIGRVNKLSGIVERLRETQIFCGDGIRAIRACDTPKCLHYVDPPYVWATRSSGRYRCEMDEAQHSELLDVLLSAEGYVILSGYRNELYTRIEAAGWWRRDYPTTCMAAGRTRGTGILGEGAGRRMQPRVESVWISPRTAFDAGL